MREILFEGKRTDNNEWICGSLKHTKIKDFDYYEIITLDNLQSATVKPETIRQFTGLTDKNGKKIFEGDIVRGCWRTVFSVYFDECYLQFRAKLPEGTERDIDYYGNSEKLETIGNIHDNPELLGE